MEPKWAGPVKYDPMLWKGLGDELLYYKEITDYRQVLSCLYAWRRTVNESRKVIKEKFPKLDLKATAWIANFPIPNAEVVLESFSSVNESPEDAVLRNLQRLEQYYSNEQQRAKLILDFVGPSMDNGFRLAGNASPRKLIISMGLALMIATALKKENVPDPYDKWDFHFDGGVSLKGIRGGKPYPLFWIDLTPDDEESEAKKAENLLLRQTRASLDSIILFCSWTIAEDQDHLFYPYIDPVHYVPDGEFQTIHAPHKKQMDTVRELWRTR